MLTDLVAAGAPEVAAEAHPHIGTFRLVTMVESLRAQIEHLGGEYASAPASTGSTCRPTPAAPAGMPRALLNQGNASTMPTMSSWRSATARATPSRCSTRPGPCRGQALLDRRAHRASAILDRPCPLRRAHRPSDPGRGGISYLASLLQRAHRLQLLHVPRRHGGRRDLRGGQVATNGVSQYSRNERNANSGFVVAIDPERDFPAIRSPASRCNAVEEHVRAGWLDYKAPAQRVEDFLAARPSTAIGDVAPSLSPRRRRPRRLPARLRRRRDARGTARLAARSAATTIPTC
ncbi:FAD-dependent protein [Sphingomonas sp. MMS24-JH45]